MTHALAHRLIAHRGWQARYVENSLAAVEAAIAVGARNVEIDIQLSADGHPVLFHDRDLKRLCGHKRAIHQLSLTELKTLRCSERECEPTPIASLVEVAECVAQAPQVTLYVELKKYALKQFGAEQVLTAIAKALGPARHQSILISFDLPALVHARQQGWERVGPVVDVWQQLRSPQLQPLDPDVVFVDGSCVPRGESLEPWPWPLAVYEVGTAKAARTWFGRGAALAETFDIGGVIEALGDD